MIVARASIGFTESAGDKLELILPSFSFSLRLSVCAGSFIFLRCLAVLRLVGLTLVCRVSLVAWDRSDLEWLGYAGLCAVRRLLDFCWSLCC